MKKRLLSLGLLVASMGALAGCRNPGKLTFEKLNKALSDKNYTISVYEDEFFSSIQYYDKASKAYLTENHFVDRVEKDYTFENDGVVVSVIYLNYTEVEGNYVINDGGKFVYSETYVYDDLSFDYVSESFYAIDKLFKEENGQIASAGLIEVKDKVSESKTFEAQNIEVKKDKVKFDLHFVEVQDPDNHAFDRNKTYKTELYDLGETKVNITSEIKTDGAKRV